MNIFVGNLSHEVGEEDLMNIFTAYGHVAAVALIGVPHVPLNSHGRRSQYSDQESRRYAYIEMPDDKEALAAIDGANAKLVRGRAVTVLQAMPMEKKKSRSA